MKNLPPLQWLRSFEAAARHLSFTAAASELHLTQSAISQQVRLLESHLGKALFIRKPRGLELTEDATYFLKTVQASFKTLQQGTDIFRGKDADNVLDIKANWPFAVLWLAPRIGDFVAQHPWVQLNVSTAWWETDISSSGASVEIRYGIGEWEDTSSGEQLTTETCYPVCAPELADAFDNVDNIANGPLIHVTAARDEWNNWLRFSGVESPPRPKSEHWCSTYIITFALARQKLGVALAHDILCRDLIDAGKLVQLSDQAMPMQENYYLTCASKHSPNEASRVFREWLLEKMAKRDN